MLDKTVSTHCQMLLSTAFPIFHQIYNGRIIPYTYNLFASKLNCYNHVYFDLDKVFFGETPLR